MTRPAAKRTHQWVRQEEACDRMGISRLALYRLRMSRHILWRRNFGRVLIHPVSVMLFRKKPFNAQH